MNDDIDTFIATAPGLGQHTDEICQRIAGLSQARIAEMRAAGVFE